MLFQRQNDIRIYLVVSNRNPPRRSQYLGHSPDNLHHFPSGSQWQSLAAALGAVRVVEGIWGALELLAFDYEKHLRRHPHTLQQRLQSMTRERG